MDAGFLWKNVFLKERPNFLVVNETVDTTLSEGPYKVFNGIRGNDPLGAWNVYSFAICKKKIPVCGDMECDVPDEDAANCPSDCSGSSSSSSSSMPSCNNDTVCDAGEDMTCIDCMSSSSSSSSSMPSCNNDSICDADEDSASCPSDCMGMINTQTFMCMAQ